MYGKRDSEGCRDSLIAIATFPTSHVKAAQVKAFQEAMEEATEKMAVQNNVLSEKIEAVEAKVPPSPLDPFRGTEYRWPGHATLRFRSLRSIVIGSM